MNNIKIFLFVSAAFFSLSLNAQKMFTPYDYFPGIIREYKPAFQENYPEWGKMLYKYPVNFNEITNKYRKYISEHGNGENALTRYFKIWSRVVGEHVDNNGEIELPDLTLYYAQLKKAQIDAFGGKRVRDTANWTFLGPKETYWLNTSGSDTLSCPWQANVYSFDVASTDNNIIYCGTETGFVNKTTDGGLNWQLMSPEYPFGGGITAISINPLNENIVYVSAGNQIHKSTDGGNSWTPLLNTGQQFSSNQLTIDPSNPQKIYSTSSNGVHLTTDGGITWTQKWNSPSWDVEIKPGDPNTVYVLTKNGGNFALAVSTDGGTSFSLEPSFVSSITEVSGGLLSVCDANPDLLYVIMLSSDNTPYLYKGIITNGSWNWQLVATGNTPQFPMNNGQGFFDLAMDVSPVNPNMIFVGTTTLYKSGTGGTYFVAVGGYSGNFSIHPDIQDIKMLANGDTWVATDGGMNLSTDYFLLQSNYHVRINGLVGSDMWGFDQGWNEDITVGGRYHNGNTAIADFYQPKALRMGGAESPTGWVVQGKSRHVAFNDLGNGWILPPTATDPPGGRFLFSKYPNMDEYGGRRSNFVTHTNYYGTFFLGENNGFWKSTDVGESYELLHTFPGKVRYLQISYSNPDVFYADIVNKGLYKSEDGGYTWTLKPALCSSPYGTSYWKGKLFFAISPYNENVIYACLQNGTWTADIGKVFRSTDGGDTWEDWTGSVSAFTKDIVVQPSNNGTDIVYLFTTSRGGSTAMVYYRKEGMSDWETFSQGYPAGMDVNLALPFFRDGKLRVAGSAGVWESPLLETDFTPIINPWVEREHFSCMWDTIVLDDHSILNHDGATWTWNISPEPEYIENIHMRNPKVVPGHEGNYTVTLTVEKNGESYSKTIVDMFSVSKCPSIEDCNNPAELPKEEWSLLYVDSEETNFPGLAVMSFDGDPSTIWHTRWSTGSDPYPHEIQIDMGRTYKIFKFTYLTRQDGQNGRIKDYELYISDDENDWGEPVSTGQFTNTSAPQSIEFPDGVIGRYFRLLALSEVNGNPWASAAEFTMVGCTDITSVNSVKTGNKIKAFPVPSNGKVCVPLPSNSQFTYMISGVEGKIFKQGIIGKQHDSYSFNLTTLPKGLYFIKLTDDNGTVYSVKVVLGK